MRPEFATFDVKQDDTPGAASEGTALRLPELCIDHTIQVGGTFVADLRLEASNDGVTWVELDAFTAPEIASYEGTSFKMLRIRTEAWTSETDLVVTYGGMNTRVES